MLTISAGCGFANYCCSCFIVLPGPGTHAIQFGSNLDWRCSYTRLFWRIVSGTGHQWFEASHGWHFHVGCLVTMAVQFTASLMLWLCRPLHTKPDMIKCHLPCRRFPVAKAWGAPHKTRLGNRTPVARWLCSTVIVVWCTYKLVPVDHDPTFVFFWQNPVPVWLPHAVSLFHRLWRSSVVPS